MSWSAANTTEQAVRQRKMASNSQKIAEEQSSEDELYSVDPGAPLLEESNAEELKEVHDKADVGVVQTSEGESSWMIALQVFGPFIIAGFGTVGAGMVLDIVQVNFEMPQN